MDNQPHVETSQGNTQQGTPVELAGIPHVEHGDSGIITKGTMADAVAKVEAEISKLISEAETKGGDLISSVEDAVSKEIPVLEKDASSFYNDLSDRFSFAQQTISNWMRKSDTLTQELAVANAKIATDATVIANLKAELAGIQKQFALTDVPLTRASET